MQSAPADAAPLPILVIDDDSALIRTLADILKFHGYAPTTAATAREGLELAQNTQPALAVVDLRLPDMDGMELVAKLHEMSSMTEVVVLTGNASIESAVAALREHSVDYLLKPVQVDRLLQVASVATERWQRRQAEERLRETDERFRRVIESDLLGIMFCDNNGLIYDANNAFLSMVGYTREEIELGQVFSQSITPPEFMNRDAEKIRQIGERGVIDPYEKEYVRKDGSRVPILIGAASLYGTGDRFVCFVLDITSRKEAEHALEARARQQEAVAHFGRRAMVASSVSDLLGDATETVARTLSLPVASVLERRSDGRVLVLRAGVGWDDRALGTTVEAVDSRQAGYTLNHSETVAVRDFISDRRFPDTPLKRDFNIVSGVTVPIPGAASPFGVLGAYDRHPREYTQDQKHFLEAIAHIVGTAAEKNRADTALRQTQRLEAVGRLASGVAHDFNNMLTAITGYGEMLRMAMPEGDPARDDVDEILKAAQRAAGLTRQLLAFSRQQVLQPRLVNLNDIVRGMEGMVTRLIGSDVQFVTALAKDLGLTKADQGQIEQVILNLCVNARDAMPNGGRLTVETANVQLDKATNDDGDVASGEYVMLAVTDTGTGMDAETKAKIYEPFFTTKPADKGTGLGLATVYGIVKQSGGEIFLYSELGKGTSFKIYLPVAQDDGGEDNGAEVKRARAVGTETVLVVDDEDAVRRITERVLRRAGYHVLVARNGKEALEVAQAHMHPIQLLVTDMVMPEMNGNQLAEELRSRRPDIRTLYFSGFTDSTVVSRGLLNGTEHFVQKPFSADVLTRKVREVLDSPHRQRS